MTQKLFDLSARIPFDTPEKVKYPVNVWPKGRLVEHVASPKYTHRIARKAKVTGSIRYLAIFLCFWGSISRANAHPHVFVETSIRIIFDDQRRIVAIQSAWTFDESYSAFVTLGLTADDSVATVEQLRPIADTNIEQLAAFEGLLWRKTNLNAQNSKNPRTIA